MPIFTIETTYRLPVYRQRSYEAETLDAACALAIADEGWDDEKSDVETSGDTYVTGAWDGRDAAYRGRALIVPSQFGEQVHVEGALHVDAVQAAGWLPLADTGADAISVAGHKIGASWASACSRSSWASPCTCSSS